MKNENENENENSSELSSKIKMKNLRKTYSDEKEENIINNIIGLNRRNVDYVSEDLNNNSQENEELDETDFHIRKPL
jgi:hypothetical protein